jgi:hypothetical protein
MAAQEDFSSGARPRFISRRAKPAMTAQPVPIMSRMAGSGQRLKVKAASTVELVASAMSNAVMLILIQSFLSNLNTNPNGFMHEEEVPPCQSRGWYTLDSRNREVQKLFRALERRQRAARFVGFTEIALAAKSDGLFEFAAGICFIAAPHERHP